MRWASQHRMWWGRAVGAALVSGLLVGTSPGVAQADKPVVITEDNTGFACESFPDGEPQVNVSINYDAVSGKGYSNAEVLTPDGELDIARGYTDAVTLGNGVIMARYPLVNEDGSTAGEVVLVGTYVAAADPILLRNRFPIARNANIIGTLHYTELEVMWTTIQVGGFDVSGISCFGQRSATTNRVLRPHRLVDTFTGLRIIGPCAEAPLSRFEIVGSEVGVSIGLGFGDLSGWTNLALADGGDTQPVEWYAEDGQDPVAVTSLTVTLLESGHSRSVVTATPDGLVLEHIQPLTLSYDVDLPDGAATVSGRCAVESVVTRIAVEPVD